MLRSQAVLVTNDKSYPAMWVQSTFAEWFDVVSNGGKWHALTSCVSWIHFFRVVRSHAVLLANGKSLTLMRVDAHVWYEASPYNWQITNLQLCWIHCIFVLWYKVIRYQKQMVNLNKCEFILFLLYRTKPHRSGDKWQASTSCSSIMHLYWMVLCNAVLVANDNHWPPVWVKRTFVLGTKPRRIAGNLQTLTNCGSSLRLCCTERNYIAVVTNDINWLAVWV